MIVLSTKNVLEKYTVSKYLNSDSVYLTPNMTYNPRVMKKEKRVCC